MSKNEIKRYLAKIGAIGGRKSRRILTPEQARAMVVAREKKKKKAIKIPVEKKGRR